MAEIRSAAEKGSLLISSMQIKLFSKGEERGGYNATIKSTLPYIKSDIPIVIFFSCSFVSFTAVGEDGLSLSLIREQEF